LCQWERGEIELRPKQIVRIAEVLHEGLNAPLPAFKSAIELARSLDPTVFENDPASVRLAHTLEANPERKPR